MDSRSAHHDENCERQKLQCRCNGNEPRAACHAAYIYGGNRPDDAYNDSRAYDSYEGRGQEARSDVGEGCSNAGHGEDVADPEERACDVSR